MIRRRSILWTLSLTLGVLGLMTEAPAGTEDHSPMCAWQKSKLDAAAADSELTLAKAISEAAAATAKAQAAFSRKQAGPGGSSDVDVALLETATLAAAADVQSARAAHQDTLADNRATWLSTECGR